jgi:hypothetical protein
MILFGGRQFHAPVFDPLPEGASVEVLAPLRTAEPTRLFVNDASGNPLTTRAAIPSAGPRPSGPSATATRRTRGGRPE